MSVVCCKIGKFKENCDSSDSKKDKTLVYTRTRAREIVHYYFTSVF